MCIAKIKCVSTGKTNGLVRKTLTAYSIRRFSHEQLCKIATAPVRKEKREREKNQKLKILFEIDEKK